MRQVTPDIFRKFYELIYPDRGVLPLEQTEFIAADTVEVANYAGIYGFSVDSLYAAVNKSMAEKAASPYGPMTVVEMMEVARLLDAHPDMSGGGYEQRFLATLERINAVYGCNGTDYDISQAECAGAKVCE